MRITIDTDKGIFIVPNTFKKNLEKQNEILKKAGVPEDKYITERKFIEEAITEAFKRPILTKEQSKDWNPDLVGVVAIGIGIWFLQRKFYSVTSLNEITFGADFYTEIYNASRRIHNVVGHINDLIEYVKKGIGFGFIFGGIIDICVFGSKLNLASSDIGINEDTTTNEAKMIPANKTIDIEEVTSENK